MPQPRKRIRVYGQPLTDPDPDLMVQVLILLGRDLHRAQRAKEQPAHPASDGRRPDIIQEGKA